MSGFYTGESYEARCERLKQREDETREQWYARMAEEMRQWANGYERLNGTARPTH
jgi:dephospho-CoA kinase